MGKAKASFVVTHSYAADPDPAKVQATLEFWKDALAERILATESPREPIARITLNLPPTYRPARKARKKAAGT